MVVSSSLSRHARSLPSSLCVQTNCLRAPAPDTAPPSRDGGSDKAKAKAKEKMDERARRREAGAPSPVHTFFRHRTSPQRPVRGPSGGNVVG